MRTGDLRTRRFEDNGDLRTRRFEFDVDLRTTLWTIFLSEVWLIMYLNFQNMLLFVVERLLWLLWEGDFYNVT